VVFKFRVFRRPPVHRPDQTKASRASLLWAKRVTRRCLAKTKLKINHWRLSSSPEPQELAGSTDREVAGFSKYARAPLFGVKLSTSLRVPRSPARRQPSSVPAYCIDCIPVCSLGCRNKQWSREYRL